MAVYATDIPVNQPPAPVFDPEELSRLQNVRFAGTGGQSDTGAVDPRSLQSISDVIRARAEDNPETEIFGAGRNLPVAAETALPKKKYEQKPLPNVLHDYNNYTYNLSLHMIGTENYNKIIGAADPSKVYTPLNVLVASGGKYGANFVRDPAFTEDFFFDNFRMKTYVNTTERNRNSNLIECSFTIIEPNGFTFINRLIDAYNRIEGNNNPGSYLFVPYMIQVDFYGSSEGAQVFSNTEDYGLIKGSTKYIPIKIVDIKTKLTNKGAEYSVSAVPFNHQAFQQTHLLLPISTSVTGKTVKEIFSGAALSPDQSDFGTQLSTRSNLEREISRLESFLSDAGAGYLTEDEALRINNQLARSKQQLTNEFSKLGITGYCDAVNEYLASLTSQGITELTGKVNVIFDKEIGDANLLNFPQNQASAPTTGNNTQSQKAEIRANSGLSSTINLSGGTINIPANMNLDKLIDWAVRNSEYITKQISDDNEKIKVQNGGTPLATVFNWFRIVPQLKIKGFDKKTNRYVYEITYFVKKFRLANKHPFAPKGRVPGYVKQYDYFFTGKNKDIITLDIDFNVLFAVEMSSNRNRLRTTQTNPAVLENENTGVSQGASTDQKNVANQLTPLTVIPVTDNPKTRSRTGGNANDAMAAGDVQRSLMTPAKGDMVTVDLKIIGDPHLVKQDDLFYDQTSLDQDKQFINNNSDAPSGQSFYMDGGELYIFLNFVSPSDYDETTGLMKDDKYKYSAFRGVYKIITIDNDFVKGKFVQTLNLVKLFFDQEGEPLADAFSSRSESLSITPIIRQTATRYAGPLINLNAGVPLTQPLNNALQLANNASQAARNAPGILRQVLTAAVTQAATGALTKGIQAGLDKVISSATKELKSIYAGFQSSAQSAAVHASYHDAGDFVSSAGVGPAVDIFEGVDPFGGAGAASTQLAVDESFSFGDFSGGDLINIDTSIDLDAFSFEL